MAIDLRGLPIAITGASSGIGLATAIECARAGMPVALGARRVDRLEAAVAEIEKAGGRAIGVACDVARAEDCERLVDECARAFGGVYAAFANAGYGIEGLAHELSDEAYREIFDVNFFGTLRTIRPALARMLDAGRGHVLICSSFVSKLGIPTLSAYSATKAAQDHVGRALRIELAGRVHVSTVHPIGTDTEFSSVVTARSGDKPRTARAPRAWRQPAGTVARAVVSCLRRPRGEVWTRASARWLAGLAVACPSLADRMLARNLNSQRRAPA